MTVQTSDVSCPRARRRFEVRLARCPVDVLAAKRLRYSVFVEELGALGAMVNHAARIEEDVFDALADHLLLIDPERAEGDHVVGLYRLMETDAAQKIGQFYSENEYDLRVLKASGKRLLEMGRSCVHPDYRNSAGLLHLWNGLAEHIKTREIDVLFGVASFRGTDVDAFNDALSYLHHTHLAPSHLRMRAKDDVFTAMDRLPMKKINRRRALMQTPALIKAYLKLGGRVGEGAFVDHDFNTIDVCMVVETKAIDLAQKKKYTRKDAA